ncbi:hypothetical protein ACWEOR_28075, partial [Micromonospora chalcea]
MPLTEPHDDHSSAEEPVLGVPGAGEDAPTPVEPEPTLPEPVRQRIVTLTAAVLPGLPADEVPVPLRRVAKFAPNRRARLGAPTRPAASAPLSASTPPGRSSRSAASTY